MARRIRSDAFGDPEMGDLSVLRQQTLAANQRHLLKGFIRRAMPDI
jgi:hypothetical protein